MTKDKFKPAFLALCEMFGKDNPSPELTAMYFKILDGAGMTDDDFQKAVSHVMLTHKYNTLPKPAELLASTQGDPEQQALFAMDTLEKAIRNHGAYASVTFTDPVLAELIASFDGGWIGLCETTLDEWVWIHKDFIKMYQARLASGQYRREKVDFIGRHEASGAEVTRILVDSGRIQSPSGFLEGNAPGYLPTRENRLQGK